MGSDKEKREVKVLGGPQARSLLQKTGGIIPPKAVIQQEWIKGRIRQVGKIVCNEELKTKRLFYLLPIFKILELELQRLDS